jgi:hypothetical protein
MKTITTILFVCITQPIMSPVNRLRAWLRRWLRPHRTPVYGPYRANVRRIL